MTVLYVTIVTVAVAGILNSIAILRVCKLLQLVAFALAGRVSFELANDTNHAKWTEQSKN